MKYIIILTLLSLNINAEPYRVKSFFESKKGIETIDINTPDGWRISKSESEHGDYLMTNIKSVYFIGTLLQETNDDNQPISLADFEQLRSNNNAQKQTLNGIDIYFVVRKNDKNEIQNYTFSRFIKPGYAFHASMIPYPEYKNKALDQEIIAVIKMLSKTIFPDEFNLTSKTTSE